MEIQNNTAAYDVAVIGGGLAGLGLAINLARKGYAIILFEKENYPFHKVCGEYISLESWDYLTGLGVDLDALQVPIIRKLALSSGTGKIITQNLPLGGFGISRYLLDSTLADLARNAGVEIRENSKVQDVENNGEQYTITVSGKSITARLACGCFGKRSNLDVRWDRRFITASKNRLNNYIGVKYHIHTDFPSDTIALHNFPQGYAGLSKVEGEQYNFCYLATASHLQRSGNSIEELEKTVLAKNPNLKFILENHQKIDKTPVTISQISFDKKSQVEHHLLLMGDAAGMITPLCGNGMSMALHAGKLAIPFILKYLKKKISLQELEIQYTRQWKKMFSSRLRMGRIVQRISLRPFYMNTFIHTAKIFPGLLRQMIRQTHGDSF